MNRAQDTASGLCVTSRDAVETVAWWMQLNLPPSPSARRTTMSTTLRGLVYVKQGSIGTKSEGPDYILQTKNEEYLLHLGDRHHWTLDYKLEFYCRRFVEVVGSVDKATSPATLKVSSIQDTLDTTLRDLGAE
jgi:hypothetical protein